MAMCDSDMDPFERHITRVGTQVGDRVAMEPGIACNVCTACKEGRYNLCEEMKFFATPPVHGSLANEVVHPAGAHCVDPLIRSIHIYIENVQLLLNLQSKSLEPFAVGRR